MWGLYLQAAGMGMQAAGSYWGARMQSSAIQHSAVMDQINANSSALALTGQADLELLNAEAQASAARASADFGVVQAEHDANLARQGAEIRAVRAGAQSAQAEASAQMDELSAQLSELQALSILQRGEYKEQDSRMEFAREKSKATASMAARGLDLGEGAPLSIRAGYDLMSENTAIRIQQAVLADAFGQRMQAQASRVGAAGKRATAALSLAESELDTKMANINADYGVSSATAQSTATKALAAAGLLNARAGADYKKTMASVMRDNASAAAMIKQVMGSQIDPFMAGLTSLIGGAGQVAQSWYRYTQTTGKLN